jgi:hypothetical protein
MKYNLHNILEEDVFEIKKNYRKGLENSGDDLNNIYNKRVDKKYYNSYLFYDAENFWCDLYNNELVDLVKKYVKINDFEEYIADVHYVNYKIGEGAYPHTDTNSSIRTYVMVLSKDYEGGDFYLEHEHVPFGYCQMIEFNADLLHEVTPITKGNREVLVVFIKKSIKNKKSLL